MGHIDFGKLDAGVWTLEEEAKRVASLGRQAEELIEKGQRKAAAFPIDDTRVQSALTGIQEAAGLLEKEALALKQASDALRRISSLYKRAELRVLDICQGEYFIVPRTEFGVSSFEGLQKYRELMSFAADPAAQEEDDTAPEDPARKEGPGEDGAGALSSELGHVLL